MAFVGADHEANGRPPAANSDVRSGINWSGYSKCHLCVSSTKPQESTMETSNQIQHRSLSLWAAFGAKPAQEQRPDRSESVGVRSLSREPAKPFATLMISQGRPNIFGGAQSAGRNCLAAWQRLVIVSYIEKHMAETIRIRALARFVYLNTNCFSRAFKRSFGMPPHRYLIRRKMERAKVLLASSTWSIADVALALGFRHRSSFAAAFRRATRLSPSEYRRANI